MYNMTFNLSQEIILYLSERIKSVSISSENSLSYGNIK